MRGGAGTGVAGSIGVWELEEGSILRLQGARRWDRDLAARGRGVQAWRRTGPPGKVGKPGWRRPQASSGLGEPASSLGRDSFCRGCPGSWLPGGCPPAPHSAAASISRPNSAVIVLSWQNWSFIMGQQTSRNGEHPSTPSSFLGTPVPSFFSGHSTFGVH